ncbi:kinase-like domain-containing protein [Nemania sp. FL0031]|nr:kinase-like domain-containing protein [Nemania sp. FL0031]
MDSTALTEVDYSSILTASLKSTDAIITLEVNDYTHKTKETRLLFLTDDDEVFVGRMSRRKDEMTLDDYIKELRHVPDEKLFPEVPKDPPITVAPDAMESFFCKRPGLMQYRPEYDTAAPMLVSAEAIIMETLSQNPHPNIIRYYGCRIKRGRITGILVEEHPRTLEQFSLDPDFQELDHAAFLAAFESAVDHLHGLGLAHNDINPYNIMVSESHQPVLIDFGSCQPFGKAVLTGATPGWCEERYEREFRKSEKAHDAFALARLRQWMKEKE